jgi:glutathione S-transferase
VIAPRIGFPADASKIPDALPKAQVCYRELARLLGDQPFLAGEALSLADLMVAPQLSLMGECEEGRALLAPHPALAQWQARMEARPSMIATTWDRLLELSAAA